MNSKRKYILLLCMNWQLINFLITISSRRFYSIVTYELSGRKYNQINSTMNRTYFDIFFYFFDKRVKKNGTEKVKNMLFSRNTEINVLRSKAKATSTPMQPCCTHVFSTMSTTKNRNFSEI